MNERTGLYQISASDDSPVIRDLAQRLRNSGVPDLLRSYHSSSEALPDKFIVPDLALYPRHVRGLIRLLVLGAYVEQDNVSHVFTADIVEMLLRHGILTRIDSKIVMNGLRLVNHFGSLVFVGSGRSVLDYYYGNDSLSLGRYLSPLRGRVLDLCSGVGAQSMLSAQTADHVVSVERQEKVADLYWINAVMNDVENRTELRIGDFVEPVKGETFDYICCNPPLLPVPHTLSYPLVGDGGPDGLDFACRLLESLPQLLHKNGRCYIVGTLLGQADGPSMTRLKGIARSANLDILISVPQRISLEAGEPLFDGLVRTVSVYGGIDQKSASAAYQNHFAELGMTHVYTFVMFAQLVADGGKLIQINNYLQGRGLWAL